MLALLIAVIVTTTTALVAATTGRAERPCTHGFSSIGPVYFEHGRIVGGDTTPDTQACLP